MMSGNNEKDNMASIEKTEGKDIKVAEYHINPGQGNDEIDLLELVINLWTDRKILVYSVAVFFVIGLVIAFTSDEEYTARVKLLHEGRQPGPGISLAQQFGLGNFQTGIVEGIPPRLYPDIVESYPFLVPLLRNNIYFSEIDDSLSLLSYFNDYYSDITLASRIGSGFRKYTIGLPSTVSGWFGNKVPPGEIQPAEFDEEGTDRQRNSFAVLEISDRERRAVNRLRSRITVRNDEGTVTVSTKMPEPRMTTDLVEHVTNSLIEFIKNYRTEKARIDVEFVEERYREARIRFERSQEQLASFRDQNRGHLTQLALTQEQRLQGEYDLAFNVYNTLARRYEEARLKLQEETPVVQVLETAIVPTGPSEPNRKLIILIFLVIGMFTGFVLIFFKGLLKKIRVSINQKYG
jgi:uncharacterized protein involved in exopolysaccharide biosynthesis